MDKKLEKQLENFVKLQKTGNLTKQDANSILSLMETIEKEKISFKQKMQIKTIKAILKTAIPLLKK